MNIPILNACILQKVLESGRTKPCMFFCEDDRSEKNGEYVVKLKAGLESRENGLSAELIASQLANILDIPTPEPAIVKLDIALADIISDTELSRRIRESEGMNFGSRIITGGFDTWPVDKAIPQRLRTLAAEVFAFDALIQNPDRRVNKPNILWKGDELYVIDHEMGFSFIMDILPQSQPWKVTELKFIKDHLFYNKLKGHDINLDRFSGALELLSDDILSNIMANVPEEWRSSNIQKIRNHISEIAGHINEFVDELRRVLK